MNSRTKGTSEQKRQTEHPEHFDTIMRAQEKFIMYIRTKQVFSLRFRGVNDEIQPVHISTQEIEKRFFPFPKYNRVQEIEKLVNGGELLVDKENRSFRYSVTKGGKIDLNLLEVKPLPDDKIYQIMLASIKNVSLPKEAESTSYFDLFLKHQNTRPELFFKVDSFAGRVHTPISNFHRTHRPFILLDGKETTSLDVATMQPLLLGKIIFQNIGENEYSNWMNEGKDIYVELQNKADLKERDLAKKKFFEILFSEPSNALSKMFGAASWINWVNAFKGLEITENPHNVEKPHSNLAWLLQSMETKIMMMIWKKLAKANISFLSVHDEIIVKVNDATKAYEIMSEVLANEFKYFKINCDKLKPVSEQIITLKDVFRSWFLNSKNPFKIKIGNEYLTELEIDKIFNINN